MNKAKLFLQARRVGLGVCAALLGTLAGCSGHVNGPRTEVYVEPPVAEAGFAAPDDYVYYPDYECYYSLSRRQYAYREGNVWVSRPAPRRASEQVVRSSPSVKMEFHDSPAQHHAAVVKQYPKNWKPSGANQGGDRKDDRGEELSHGK